MDPETKLRWVKGLHTVVWAVFAGAILLIPVMAHGGRLGLAAGLIGLVAVEVMVLVFNRMRCPLTDVAARYTPVRRANFDIYLPEWLARHNQRIFGTLFLAGVLDTILVWLG